MVRKRFSRFLCCLLSMLGASPLWAAPRVVLLTSVERGQELLRVFEERFQGSGYELRFIPRAHAQDVWREIRDPQNIGLFYVGHAADAGEQVGVRQEPTLTDAHDNNIVDVLMSPHPGMRFVGLVACYGQKIIDRYQARGLLDSRTSYFSFRERIDPFDRWIELSFTHGLTRAIDASTQALAEPQTYDELFPRFDPCRPSDDHPPDRERYEACQTKHVARRRVRARAELLNVAALSPDIDATLTLRRTLTEDTPAGPALKISQNGKALILLPPIQAGETQEVRVPFSRTEHPLLVQALTDEHFSPSRLNGQSVSLAESGNRGHWEPVRGRSGRVLGDALRIFQFRARDRAPDRN